jgi:hypothetical protein
MVCEIIIECSKCGRVMFGNAMFPDEVGDYIICPSCNDTAQVISKQLVNQEVVMTVENVPAVMIDKYSYSIPEVIPDGKTSTGKTKRTSRK